MRLFLFLVMKKGWLDGSTSGVTPPEGANEGETSGLCLFFSLLWLSPPCPSLVFAFTFTLRRVLLRCRATCCVGSAARAALAPVHRRLQRTRVLLRFAGARGAVASVFFDSREAACLYPSHRLRQPGEERCCCESRSSRQQEGCSSAQKRLMAGFAFPQSALFVASLN